MSKVKWRNIVEAAEHNDTEAIRYFVEDKHVAMTTCNELQQTAAHIAVKHNNLPLLKYLMDKDPSIVTATDKEARNILIQAVEQDSLDVIKFLVEERMEGVSLEHNLYYGNTAVHWAALRGRFDILKYLIEDQGVDVNIRSDFGETPLFLAAEKVQMPIVKYLIEKRRARVDIIDKNNNNVLYISARRGDLSVPRYILDELKKNLNLNFRDFFGETILHRTVKFCHLHFAEYLIEEKGVNVNLPDIDGKTPLHHAAETGNVTVVKYLCENGAFTDMRNDYNQTALESAKNAEVIEYLTGVTPKSDSRRRRRRRRRRSVFGSSGGNWALQKTVHRFLWWSNDARLLGSEEVSVASNNETSSSLLESVLLFASSIFRYSTVVGCVHSSLPHSPSEILRSKVNPFAIEAVERGLGMENF